MLGVRVIIFRVCPFEPLAPCRVAEKHMRRTAATMKGALCIILGYGLHVLSVFADRTLMCGPVSSDRRRMRAYERRALAMNIGAQTESAEATTASNM